MDEDHPFSVEALKKVEKRRNRKAAMSYLWLFSVWSMLENGGDAFVAMHAKQGVTITLFTAVLFIPNLGLDLLPFVGLACLFLYGIGFYAAIKGKEIKIPGIWELSTKIFKTQYVG